ncbi:hypothetical protein A2U01_0036751, partial [Trifolium medium]|nr:hypothetical protein [Trifolium medium]
MNKAAKHFARRLITDHRWIAHHKSQSLLNCVILLGATAILIVP